MVEDEPQLLRAIQITLQAGGYDVRVATGGRRAISEAAASRPDIVILDLGLPDLDGVEVIQALRGWSSVPIIVLSGRTSGNQKVAALDAGADDYVTKPFDVGELLARIRAVSRRTAVTDGGAPSVDIGQYRVDLVNKRIERWTDTDVTTGAVGGSAVGGGPADDGAVDCGSGDGSDRDADAGADADAESRPAAQVRLTRTEWRLLEALIQHPGKLVSQRQLITEVWGPAYTDDTSSLRLYVNRLRRKLESDPSRPQHLLTEPGMGYRFQP